MMNNEEYSEVKSQIETLAKENLSKAILDVSNSNYNEDVTRNLLADFMTNRQSQMFYGTHNGQADNRYKSLVPGSDGNVVFKAPTKKKNKIIEKGKLIINGTEIESLEAYKTLGGSYTYLKDRGYYWDPKDGGWLLNEGAQFYNADPIIIKGKYDKSKG